MSQIFTNEIIANTPNLCVMLKPTEIIIHCTATVEGFDHSAKEVDHWHVTRGYRCIGYNYLIRLDGTIEKGRDLTIPGAHTRGHNDHSIGICYVGGLNARGQAWDTRTPAQRKALVRLVKELQAHYGIGNEHVHCHYEFAPKACPCFTIESFRAELEQADRL